LEIKLGHHRFDISIKTKTTKNEEINTRRNRCHTRNLNLIINRKFHQMVKKETRGRKPLDPELKKINLQLFVQQYQIDKLGGIKKTKLKLLNYIHEKTIRYNKLEA
jgi:hypothetical protein